MSQSLSGIGHRKRNGCFRLFFRMVLKPEYTVLVKPWSINVLLESGRGFYPDFIAGILSEILWTSRPNRV
jgi:hypothetical protein